MTPEEAIKQLEFDRAMILFDPTTGEEITPEILKALNKDNFLTYVADGVAIEALKEIQQYREIGTVEECREAMSRYRQRKKMVKCEECLFLEERKSGRSGAIIGVCRIKPQNGRRYGKSCACRFFEKDYKDLEGMEDE